ncbi:hypothetical protein F4860DRAFT_478939 [Xylaria cubensis]|nr:hypothetical protein F4860DRAFT_478939 [Xylaria cubensis]
MTDRCWFVLRHNYHNPPVMPNHGIGKSKGSLSIGHVITSTRLLDIINPETGPVDYPPSMPVLTGKVYNFEWKSTDEGHIDVSTKLDTPIGAIFGVNISLGAGVAFQKAVNRFWEFDKLEAFTVNITQSYVDDTMETTEIESYVDKHKTWLFKNPSLYIITGIMVGRKAKLLEVERKAHGVNAEVVAGASSIAAAGGSFDISSSKESSSSGQVDDFIFAVRVAKITKGLLDKTWCWATMSEGATFSADDRSDEVMASIKTQLDASEHVYEEVICLANNTKEVFIL